MQKKVCKAFISNIISRTAYTSLIEELKTTPKAGLVDKDNCGAHGDMNYALFVKSAKAIRFYFKQMWLEAEKLKENASPALQELGIQAEKTMLKATKGVNTHRGAIFSLGLFLCAVCLARESSAPPSLEKVLEKVVFYAQNLKRDNETKGSKLCQNYNIPSAFDYALGGYKELPRALIIRENFFLKEGENIANLRVLLYYMSAVKDANVYRRAGEEGANWLKERAEEISQNFSISEMKKFDADCIEKNISAGGCADMLALCILAAKLIKLKIIQKD